MTSAPVIDLDSLRDCLANRYSPETAAEHLAIERVALAKLSLLRAARFEAAAPLDAPIEELLRYQRLHATAERLHRRAVADLDAAFAAREESLGPMMLPQPHSSTISSPVPPGFRRRSTRRSPVLRSPPALQSQPRRLPRFPHHASSPARSPETSCLGLTGTKRQPDQSRG